MTLKEQLIKLGSTNPSLRPHIRHILASFGAKVSSRALQKQALDAWRKEVARGYGFNPEGGNDINRLRGTGSLVLRANNTSEVAVYEYGDTYIIVGDSNGPWAAQVAKHELDLFPQ
jgi:hypothetical protein